MKKTTVSRLVVTAVFAALIYIGTQFLSFPLAFGYFNLGDLFILICAYLIGGAYAPVAAVIGSVTADLLSPYAIYAPATLVIKALMAIVVILLCRRGRASAFRFTLSAVLAEAIMVSGYFLFETVIYGVGGAISSIPFNLLQGGAAIVLSTVVVLFLRRIKIKF